ncbi:MAG: glycosyltransferase [Sedimentisphaerales bacterium]|nr:glycosyltransferase [Sedimentisphaerales bacterium]
MNTHDQQGLNRKRTLLVFNCHEAWVSQLAVLGYPLDIIVGLKGQYKSTWDEQMRPIPPNARLLSLSDAIESNTDYYCIVTHNMSDLLDIKSRSEPRLMIIHSTLEGRALEEKSDVQPDQIKAMLHKYIELIGGHVVAVSRLKGKSWGFTEDIVPFCVDPADYPQYSGSQPAGLRICNFVQSRKGILLWDLHEKAFAGLDVRIVGHNPALPGVSAARNWSHLKELLQSHRFYIHTAHPQMEDGYNMATVEAMAAGMPILGNRHPGSPVRHGVSGFLSDDPAELRKFAQMLLENQALAIAMGRQAKKTAIERFSQAAFNEAFRQSIETARHKRNSLKIAL